MGKIMNDSNETLELEKLRAEINILKRPFWKDPNRWIPLITAIGVVIVSMTNVISAKSDLADANVSLKELKLQLKKSKSELDELERRLTVSKADHAALEQDTIGFLRLISKLKNVVHANLLEKPETILNSLNKDLFPRHRSKRLSRVPKHSTVDNAVETLYLSEYGIYFLCAETKSGQELVSGQWMTRNEAVNWAKGHLTFNKFKRLFPSSAS